MTNSSPKTKDKMLTVDRPGGRTAALRWLHLSGLVWSGLVWPGLGPSLVALASKSGAAEGRGMSPVTSRCCWWLTTSLPSLAVHAKCWIICCEIFLVARICFAAYTQQICRWQHERSSIKGFVRFLIEKYYFCATVFSNFFLVLYSLSFYFIIPLIVFHLFHLHTHRLKIGG